MGAKHRQLYGVCCVFLVGALAGCQSFPDSCKRVLEARCDYAKRCDAAFDVATCKSGYNSVCGLRSLVDAADAGTNGCREGYTYDFALANACASAWDKHPCGTDSNPLACLCEDCAIGYEFCRRN